VTGDTLHLVNGESVAGSLRVPGEIAIWRDVLCEGPVPSTADDAGFARARAEYLAAAGFASYDRALAGIEEFHTALARAGEFAEVVIWCEYDLFDQVMLLRVLEWIGRHGAGSARVSLIDAGTLLGRFTSEELAALMETRAAVTPAQLGLARAAWSAYTAEDPRGIVELLSGDTGALPFLHGALRRHLEEFPSARNGLSRTEETALRIAVERGPLDQGRLFVAVQAEEERPFLGDTSFFRMLRAMRELIDENGAATELGRRVLAGDAGWTSERSMGGAQVERWRWDGARLTAAPGV
jgi:hypothetical protein